MDMERYEEQYDHPGCVCDDCDVGKEKHCGHAYGYHYDIWGEGLGTPDYCPQRPDPDDPDVLPW